MLICIFRRPLLDTTEKRGENIIIAETLNIVKNHQIFSAENFGLLSNMDQSAILSTQDICAPNVLL
jgi:hypothetical protein